jgi:hypothetical protein
MRPTARETRRRFYRVGGGCHEDWIYAGRDQFVRDHILSARDVAFGRSTNPQNDYAQAVCWTISESNDARRSASVWVATHFLPWRSGSPTELN